MVAPRGKSAVRLRDRLDRLCAAYGAERLSRDPVSLVRRYRDPADREVAGLVAAALAFGAVPQVLRSVSRVLDAVGPRPARALLRGRDVARSLEGFRHRWVKGADVALFLGTIGRILRSEGSIESYFGLGGGGEKMDLGGLLTSFSRRAKALASGGRPPGRGFLYLFPEPATGGAAKRLCLFLRWMVRPDDGLDLGLWRSLSPAELVIPLDTHVLRISRYVGLTERRTAGWATALDITSSLAALSPDDPTRYDFALAQLGISKGCIHRRHPDHCPGCPLHEVCAL